MDELNNFNTIGLMRQSQSQVLNNHLVISGFDQSFRFVQLARCVHLESML